MMTSQSKQTFESKDPSWVFWTLFGVEGPWPKEDLL